MYFFPVLNWKIHLYFNTFEKINEACHKENFRDTVLHMIYFLTTAQPCNYAENDDVNI